MKKFQKIALGVFALLLLLAGCGKDEETPVAPAAQAPPQSVDPELDTELDPELDPEPTVSIYAATGLYNPAVKENGYDPARFHLADGFMIYTGFSEVNSTGIDVSSHQKEIDWMQVAEAGVDFAMIRVGYRGYETGDLNLDRYFETNIDGALKAGLDVGIYFFSQATDVAEAEAEAAQVLEWIAPYQVTYPVVFDWEPVFENTARTNGVDAETVTDCALAFCEAVKKSGYIPAVYSNKKQAYEIMDLTELTEYDFWLAEYTDVPEFCYHFEMWQYSCTGTVPGISTPVDLNLCLKKYPEAEQN